MASVDQLFKQFGPSYRWYVLLTLTLATLIVVTSSTIANVAIPALMADFDVEHDVAHWVTTGFLASLPMGMLVASSLFDHWGKRRVFMVSLALFVFTSLLAAKSSSFSALVFYRVLQGLTAGIIQPLSVLTIFHV